MFEKTGIKRYFNLVITGELVSHGKPNPECYILAAQKLGVFSKEYAVLEDAPSGILAGKNAEMKVIAVPSPFVKGDSAFQKADVVVDSLKAITLKKIYGK